MNTDEPSFWLRALAWLTAILTFLAGAGAVSWRYLTQSLVRHEDLDKPPFTERFPKHDDVETKVANAVESVMVQIREADERAANRLIGHTQEEEKRLALFATAQQEMAANLRQLTEHIQKVPNQEQLAQQAKQIQEQHEDIRQLTRSLHRLAGALGAADDRVE